MGYRELSRRRFLALGTLVHAESGTRQGVWARTVVLPFSRFAFVWLLVHQRLNEVTAGLNTSWRPTIVDTFREAVAVPDAPEPRLTRGFLAYNQARGVFR